MLSDSASLTYSPTIHRAAPGNPLHFASTHNPADCIAHSKNPVSRRAKRTPYHAVVRAKRNGFTPRCFVSAQPSLTNSPDQQVFKLRTALAGMLIAKAAGMRTITKTFTIILALLGTTLAFAACNTMHGVGEDVENAGEEIQEEAN